MTPGFGDRLTVAPTWEPVSLVEAKLQCRVRQANDDSMFTGLWIPAAREWVETVTKRAIPQQQWELTLDAFPGRQVDDYRPPTWRYGIVRMPRPPLVSVQSVSYVPTDQSAQPFSYTVLSAAEYMVDANTEPGRLAPAPFLVWPATNPLAFQSVKIAFTAGYASAALVPARLRMAILLMVAHIYEHREAGIEGAISLVPRSLESFATAASPWEYC